MSEVTITCLLRLQSPPASVTGSFHILSWIASLSYNCPEKGSDACAAAISAQTSITTFFQSAPTAVPKCFLSVSDRHPATISTYLASECLPGCNLHLHPSEHGSSLSVQLHSLPSSVAGHVRLCLCVSTCPCLLPTRAAVTACLCCPAGLQFAFASVPDCFSCRSGCNLLLPLAQKVSSDCSLGLQAPRTRTAVEVNTFVSQMLHSSSLHSPSSRSHRHYHAASILHCSVSSLSSILHATTSTSDTSNVSSGNRP